ncbi:KH domain-containing protein [Desulfobacterota bacterium AH_259_B03_O07]|nr:KH domain-containing protein [Desulfobacterota bacterium AH_259_B03_O07]
MPTSLCFEQITSLLFVVLIRVNLTYQEIPYKPAVMVEEFEEDSERNLIRISAVIYVERENHKGIIIGGEGQM